MDSPVSFMTTFLAFSAATGGILMLFERSRMIGFLLTGASIILWIVWFLLAAVLAAYSKGIPA